MSLHYITHAVCVAVIATLVRKYFYITYQFEELEIKYESCMDHIEGKSDHFAQHKRPYQTDGKKQESLEEVNDFIDEVTVAPGLEEKINNFVTSREMEYFDEYLGTKSEESDNYATIDDYTGTQFTQQTVTELPISNSNTKHIAHSATKINKDGGQTDAPHLKQREEKSVVQDNSFSKSKYTSVWCSGSSVKDRICHFHNLCYHTIHKDFIYFHSNESVQENLSPSSDFYNILDLSSVANHSLNHFSFVKLPFELMNEFDSQWVKPTSLIFKRFKPDNIMHVIHDDILPLHQTLKQIAFGNNESSKLFDIQLISLDGWVEGKEFEFLYDILSKHRMLTQQSLAKMAELVCFEDSFVGISKSTTWYQYGFHEPQGPLSDRTISAHHIHDTVNYILANIKNECQFCTSGDYLVLFSRKDTRLILNEMELSVAIAQNIGIKVLSVSLETHALQDIINIVRHSKGVLGMHGSLMALAVFLQPGSILMELFPFAVNSFHYTPYKTLAQLPNMNIGYNVWVNTHEDNTIMHPDWSPELGGIYHLSNQQEIMNQKEIPRHLCCDDPSWLFHIYQDTKVDIPVVIKLLESLLSKQSGNAKNVKHSQTLAPGPVRNLKCVLQKNSASVKWKAPWSLQYVVYQNLSYELWFHDLQSNSTSSFILPNVTHHSVSSVKQNTAYLVWVRCNLDNVLGSFGEPVKCRE